MLETRIVDMPFVFTAKVVPYRARNAKDVHAWSTIPVRISMVSDADAPVAVEWEQRKSYDETDPDIRAKHYANGPHVYRVRHYEGRLYRSLDLPIDVFVGELTREANRYNFEARRKLSTHDYPAMPAVKTHYQRERFPSDYYEWDDLIRTTERDKGRIKEDDRDARAHEAASILQDVFLVVDGTVWTSEDAREPHYRVSRGARPDISVTLAHRPTWYTSDYPISQADQAAEEAMRIGLPGLPPDRLTILVPEALGLDPAILMAQQAIECLCVDVTNRNEPWGDEAAWLVADIRSTRDSRLLDLPRAVKILDAYDRLDRLLADLPEDTDGGEMRRRVAPIVQRWRIERAARPEIVQVAEANELDDAILGGL